MSTKLPPIDNATTLGAQAVQAVSPSPGLLLKTARVIVGEGASGPELRVIRASSTSRGEMSCEVYMRKGGDWGPVRKIKGPKLPPEVYEPPPGAIRDEIDGIDCFTVAPLTAEERDRLRGLIARAMP